MRLGNIIRRAIIAFFLVFAVCCRLSFAQDKVVAIINNEIITQKDLNDFVNFMRVQLSAEYKGEQLVNKIQSMKLDLLDKLIEDKLILQEARNQNIIIEESRIKAKIDEIKDRIGSDADFQESLKQQGLVQADLERRIREQLLMYAIIDYKIRSKIVVDPSEVTEFYGRNKEEFKSREQREFEAIAVEDEETAMKISAELKEGQPIAAVAEKYKAEINKFNVGRDEELKKEISSAISGLNINEASDPVKSENKFYIFMLTKMVTSRQQSLDEAKDSIQNFLFERKMQEELGEWLDGLKKRSYIKILSD